MSSCLSLYDMNLMYRVNHPEFDLERIYRAFAYFDYGETAWSYIMFINERGMTYSVRVDRTVCIGATAYSEEASSLTMALPFPRPTMRNPDIEHIDE